MGYGEACINMQIIMQHIFSTPWKYDPNCGHFIRNRAMNSIFIIRLLKLPFWYLYKIGFWLVFTYSVYHLINISDFRHSDSPIVVQEAIIYVVLIIGSSASLVCSHVADEASSAHMSTINMIFYKGNVKYIGLPTTERPPDFQELLVYIAMSIFLCFPYTAAAIPFVIDFDPLNRILTEMFTIQNRKIVAAFTYLFGVYIAANVNGIICLILLSCIELFERSSQNDLKASRGVLRRETAAKYETLLINCALWIIRIIEWVYPKWRNQYDRTMSLQRKNYKYNRYNFKICYTSHINWYILVEQCNLRMAILYPNLVGFTIIFCVLSNFWLISFYDQNELKILWWCILILGQLIYLLAIFFFHHGSSPIINTEETIMFWKGNNLEIREKKQLRSMIPYANKITPFCKVEKKTILAVLNTILDFSATLLLAFKV